MILSFHRPQIKPNKQSATYWRVSLANLCRMLSGLRQDAAWGGQEEEEEGAGPEAELREGGLQLLEEQLYNLQQVCRVLQGREERVRRHAHAHRRAQAVGVDLAF